MFGPRTSKNSDPVVNPTTNGKQDKSLVSFDPKNIQRFKDQVTIPTNTDSITYPSDTYFRIFGTTVSTQFLTNEDIFGQSSQPFLSKLLQTLKSGKKVEFTEPIPLFSDELQIPTISGFPIYYQIKSLAIASLELKNDIANNWENIATKIVPSSTLLTRIKMRIGYEQILTTGFQLEIKGHQSGAIEFKSNLAIKDTAGTFSYETRLNIPDDKIKFLELKNEMFWIEGIDGNIASKRNVKSSMPFR